MTAASNPCYTVSIKSVQVACRGAVSHFRTPTSDARAISMGEQSAEGETPSERRRRRSVFKNPRRVPPGQLHSDLLLCRSSPQKSYASTRRKPSGDNEALLRRLQHTAVGSAVQSFRDSSQSSNSDRETALERVFRAFDLDGSGSISRPEMLSLGKARRRDGARSPWTEAKNKALVAKVSWCERRTG